MKNVKTILCLISLLVAGITNVWGAVSADYNSTTKVLTISGSGAMTSPLTTTSTWTSTYKSNVKEVIISNGVTAINSEAFKGFSKLATVSLPSSLTSIDTDAFDGTAVADLTYAGSPSEWAQINIANNKAHPYYGTAASRKFYFYGSGTATTNLVLSPTITTVKQFAFYNASFSNIYIPGTVETIEKRAFYCSIASGGVLVINRRDAAPSIVTTSGETSFMNQSRKLYYPTGATGYDAVGGNYEKTGKDISGTMAAPKGADITWDLSEDGILTLNATGATKTISFSSYTDLPWSVYRRLVDKVVLQGGIEEITETFTYCFGLNEIEIDQSKIPTVTPTGANVAIAFTSRFDQRKNVQLYVKPSALADASADNLGSAPWSDTKLDIQLSDDVTIDQASADNTTILTNCSTYVEKPVNVQLTRSTFSPQYYNTFCSPVSMTESEIKTLFGDTTHLVELDDAVVEKDTLRLNFKDATSIVAGQPYLIKPENSITNPRFTGITPTALATSGATVEGTDASFYGILSPLDITNEWAEGKNFIFLLADNKFTYATGGTLKGMRAYFLLDDDVEPGVLAHSPKMRINYEAEGGQTPTVIDKTQTEVKAEKVMENGVMYIIKNGVKYSVMGERVR